jgi:protein-S-isoprenylcysteine O-methyltransferase Ste14
VASLNHPDPMNTSGLGRNLLRRLFLSTPARTFVLYPLAVIAFELVVRRGNLVIVPWGALLLLWGYLQYRLTGHSRVDRGGGGPGITVPPERLVQDGIYAYTRNPMYLGHLIFMLGLAVTFWSWLALVLLAVNAIWFHRRVLDDEARLRALFGAPYEDYQARVKRWIPGVL